MSRSYHLGHAFGIVAKNNFKTDLYATFQDSVDEDMNGNNGDEYLPQEVVAAGYESTVAWAIDLATEKYGFTKDAITHFLASTIGSNHYYDEYKYHIEETDDSFIVSVAWMCGN